MSMFGLMTSLRLSVLQERCTLHMASVRVSFIFLLVICWNVQSLTAQSGGSASVSDSEPFDVNFPQSSAGGGYAITDDIPDMTSFSFCFWVKLVYNPGGSKSMTLLSYTNAKFQKAYLLETSGSAIDIYMDDEPIVFPGIDLKDENWHHVCTMWDQSNRETIVYFEGVHGVTLTRQHRQEKVLKGGGSLVIGALLKKQQGVFSNHLKGSLSNLNIWNRYLTADEVQNVYRACDLNRGNVLYWCAHVIGPMLRNGATMTTPSSACSGSYADAMFTTQPNSRLMGHKITHYIVRDEFACTSYCLRNCRCQSFDLRERPDGKYFCQLNSATAKEFPDDLIDTGNRNDMHYGMVH